MLTGLLSRMIAVNESYEQCSLLNFSSLDQFYKILQMGGGSSYAKVVSFKANIKIGSIY